MTPPWAGIIAQHALHLLLLLPAAGFVLYGLAQRSGDGRVDQVSVPAAQRVSVPPEPTTTSDPTVPAVPGWLPTSRRQPPGSVLAPRLATLAAEVQATVTGPGHPTLAAPGDATLIPCLAVASAVAGTIHGAVCNVHFHESLLYGFFFVAVASVQLIFTSLVLRRPDRRLLAAGLVGNGAVLVLWLVTRTVGIPLGPSSGNVETVGILDVIATAAEVAIVALCWAGLRRPELRVARRWTAWSVTARTGLALGAGTAALAVGLVTVT